MARWRNVEVTGTSATPSPQPRSSGMPPTLRRDGMRRPPSQWRSAIRWPANWEQKRWKAQEREGGRGECYQSGGAGGGGRGSRGPFESNLPSGPRKRSDPGGEASVDHFGEFPELLRGEEAVVGDHGKRDAHSLGAPVAGV